MCVHCHKNLQQSEQETVRQYKEELINPRYEDWNTTSLNFIIMSMLNIDGDEAKKLAFTLYDNFCKWAENSEKKDLIDPIPSVDKLKCIRERIISSNITKHEIYEEDGLDKIYEGIV